MSARAAQTVRTYDLYLLGAGLFLAGFGLVMVLSASAIMAEKFWHDKLHFFSRQGVAMIIGLLAMVFCAVVPRGFFYRLTYLWLLLAAGLLLATVFTPLGLTVNGAKRWLALGPFTFQPLEAVKVALVLYLGYFFAAKQDRVKRFSIGFLPPLLVTGAFAGVLLLQPDFGGAAMLCMILFLMCLVGGTRLTYLAASALLVLGAGAMLIIHSPYRFRRLFAFLDPFKDAQNVGYQLVQSLYAFGAGRLTGVGLGAGSQKLFFLPEAHNDFLMAVVGEETGFIGVSLVLVLIAILLWRAFVITARQAELRDRFTACGLTCILGLGFILNLAVVLGTVPPKGVPMPFMSYGGSQIIMSFVCLGILLNLSRREAGR
jgi:cell division protein FtsW